MKEYERTIETPQQIVIVTDKFKMFLNIINGFTMDAITRIRLSGSSSFPAREQQDLASNINHEKN